MTDQNNLPDEETETEDEDGPGLSDLMLQRSESATPEVAVTDTLWMSLTEAVDSYLTQAESHPRTVQGIMGLSMLMHPEDPPDSRIAGLHRLCASVLCLLSNTRREMWAQALAFLQSYEEDEALLAKVAKAQGELAKLPILGVGEGDKIIDLTTGEPYELSGIFGSLADLQQRRA